MEDWLPEHAKPKQTILDNPCCSTCNEHRLPIEEEAVLSIWIINVRKYYSIVLGNSGEKVVPNDINAWPCSFYQVMITLQNRGKEWITYIKMEIPLIPFQRKMFIKRYI